tara:strand:- start:709 stop:1089 length:381 start_codon:yes stop_codon:yes gene_type:complete
MSEWPDGEIVELVKGERPTLLEAEKGNEVIDALNVLGNITIEKGTDDEVQYSADGVKIIYGIGISTDQDGTFALLNADDLTQKVTVTIEDGSITDITLSASDWVEKTITICEDGSAVDYTFLVKTS